MDVPATAAGVVQEVKVRKGDRVSKDSLIALVVGSGGDTVKIPSLQRDGRNGWKRRRRRRYRIRRRKAAAAADEPAADVSTQLLVIGAGPGGYTAAFRAADLGLSVTLVDRWPQLGGVCLNVGCIPSKALLHAARVIEEAESMSAHGIKFQAPEIDAAALKQWKNRIVGKLTAGLAILAKQRKVTVVRGTARFASAHRVGDRGRGRQEAGDRLRAVHHRRGLGARAHTGPAGRSARRRFDRRARPRGHPEDASSSSAAASSASRWPACTTRSARRSASSS